MARKSNKHNRESSRAHQGGDRKRKADQAFVTFDGPGNQQKGKESAEQNVKAVRTDGRAEAPQNAENGSSNSPPHDDKDGKNHDYRKPGQLRTPPPEVPNAVEPKALLVPPEADDAEIRKSWEIDAIAITKNSSIRGSVVRARAALHVDEPAESTLSSTSALTGTSKSAPKSARKRTIVALMARAPHANACISIAEILKREICGPGCGRSVWQYTGSWRRLEYRSKGMKGEQTANGGDGGPESEDGAFEVLKEVERRKVRNVSCLVIYLALDHVPKLKVLYGEQRTVAKIS